MADQVLQDIKDRLNVADVIASYIQVKRSGVNFKAVCPFHHEKTASLMISPQKQIWHCFGCFPPGQKVKTAFGLHDIEAIDESHCVYSGKGNLRRVLAVHRRNYSGNLVSIKVRKLGGIVSMTVDHQLRVLRPKTKYCQKTKQFYRQCADALNQKKCGSTFEAAQRYGKIIKLSAGELRPGDFVLYPIDTTPGSLKKINLEDYVTKAHRFGPRPKQILYQQPISNELLKLIGYWVAEGSSHRAYVRFSLGNHEEEFAGEIVDVVKKLFGLRAGIHRRPKEKNKTGLEITVCHARLADIFENLCGKGAQNKHLPFMFQNLPPEQQMILLEAVHRGDGHNRVISKSTKVHRSISTISRILAEQLVDVLLRNEKYPTLNIRPTRRDLDGVNHKEAYNVIWSDEARAQHHFTFFEDGTKYWALPILSIKRIKYEGPVYNLTVERDHSYVATNFSVANCGEGGDVFGFVMRYENLEFRDALKLLADKAGVVLPVYSKARQDSGEKELLLRINAFAAKFYHQVLLNDARGRPALEYLENRGLSRDTIVKWQIGFAPEEFHALETALSQKSAKAEDLVRAGVSVKNEQGQIYDRFRGRITFPIFNYLGEAVGFSARILKADPTAAKYVNSPETVIYSKSKILFGLNFAKGEIRKMDEAVLVEGQMDCIASHQAGIGNVVATSGTALSLEHLNLLARLSKNLKFCFDADSAGLSAARRAGELALSGGFNVKLISLFGAKDPDELLKQDPKLWRAAIDKAAWFIEYYIERAIKHFAFDPVARGKEINQSVLPLVASISDPLEREHYVKLLADKLGTSAKAVLEALQKAAFAAKAAVYERPKEVLGTKPAQPNLQLEKLLLGGMQVLPEFLEFMKASGGVDDFPPGEARQLFSALLAESGERAGEDQEILSSTLAREAAFMVESQLESLDGNTEAVLREIKKNFYLLRLFRIKFRQQHLARLIKQAEDQRQAELLAQYNEEFAQLSNSRMEYENLL